jgi:hypothetical protein
MSTRSWLTGAASLASSATGASAYSSSRHPDFDQEEEEEEEEELILASPSQKNLLGATGSSSSSGGRVSSSSSSTGAGLVRLGTCVDRTGMQFFALLLLLLPLLLLSLVVCLYCVYPRKRQSDLNYLWMLLAGVANLIDPIYFLVSAFPEREYTITYLVFLCLPMLPGLFVARNILQSFWTRWCSPPPPGVARSSLLRFGIGAVLVCALLPLAALCLDFFPLVSLAVILSNRWTDLDVSGQLKVHPQARNYASVCAGGFLLGTFPRTMVAVAVAVARKRTTAIAVILFVKSAILLLRTAYWSAYVGCIKPVPNSQLVYFVPPDETFKPQVYL